MKIFITGIAGFIGFHTALKFKKENYEVLGIDNYCDYYDVNLKKERARILKENNITVCAGDIRNLEYINNLILSYKPDIIIHLAAMAGVRYSMDFPQEYIDNNITGTLNLIKACENNNVSKVVFASTSCVMHGAPLPWSESSVFSLQLNPYGYSKYINESQFYISKIEKTVALRFFTVYGPYGRPDMALFDFTKNIIAGNPITIFNYGDMKRDFTYVDDVVNAIFLVTENLKTTSVKRDVYCVGYGEQVKLMDFVSEIEKNLNVVAIKQFAPKHDADAKETWSDTRKIQKLGYKSKVSIKEGVKNFVDWYRSYYQ